MKNRLTKLGDFVQDHSIEIILSIAIALIGYAFYNPALRFVPVDYDDLILLSSVKNSENPLKYFFSDWGFGNFGYRPLHSITLWIGVQFFGMSSGPNQLINILLHITIMIILFLLLRQTSGKAVIAFLSTCLVLISLYTFSPVTWVSDRPTLFVAFFLVSALYYLLVVSKDHSPNLWILLSISLLALMSKESGLIVPLISAFIIFFTPSESNRKYKLIVFLILLVAAYMVFRWIIFSGNAAKYEESGYLFGTRYYESSAHLSGAEQFISKAENPIKNFIAIFLPIFDGLGKISRIGTISNSVVLVGSMIIVAALSLGRKLTFPQFVGLFIIALNALLHFHVFRYRTLYLGQIGLVLFIASSASFIDTRHFRTMLAAALLVLLVSWNMKIIGETLTYQYLEKIDYIRTETFREDILSTSSSIDEVVVDQIIQKYRH